MPFSKNGVFSYRDWTCNILTYSFLFEIDLRDIDEAYEDSFKHKLAKSIKRKTSGDYQDLLIGILRSETDRK